MAGTSSKRRIFAKSGTALYQLAVEHNKVVTDLETLRAALEAGGVTAVIELMADHATFKTAADETNTWATEVDADHDTMNNLLDFHQADGVIGGSFTIATTAAVTLLGAGFIAYQIGGQQLYTVLDTTITLADSGDIVQNKFGAWRILIDRTGAVTTQDTGAQMAFNSAEDALLCLSAVAPTANTATIGYFTVTDSGAGGFNIGTTNTSGGTATGVVYTVRGNQKKVSGLHTANGAASAVGATPENYSTGTKDVQVNGVRVAQIAAEADKAFDDADTIGQSQFGGWLIVTNLAQTATYALAADGIAGSVSAMTYASSALASADLDTITDQLPEMFVPISRLIIQNNLAGTWTAGTDDLSGTDGTPTFTDATVGTWNRAAKTGFDSHKITPPSIPATITAPVPSAGPATLSASVPSSTAVDTAGDMTSATIVNNAGTAYS